MRYDARGRIIETEYPDGSKEKVVFGVPGTIDSPALDTPDVFEPTPWESYAYGRNDLGAMTHDPNESWSYADHYWTPASVEVDALGRVVKSIARNDGQPMVSSENMWFETLTTHDIRGNVLTVTDPLGRVAATHVYDLANRSLRTESIDAGSSRIVFDAAGLPRETRDAKGAVVLSGYDALLRETHLWARDDDSLSTGLRVHTIYGDDATNGPANPAETNHLGRPYRQYDEAARVTFAEYDFKGNLLDKERRTIDPELLIDAANSGNSRNGWTYTPHRTDWDAGETLAQREAALPALGHSDFDRLTPDLDDDLFAVLLDNASAFPASNGFDLVAQSSPSIRQNRIRIDDPGGKCLRIRVEADSVPYYGTEVFFAAYMYTNSDLLHGDF